MKSSALALAIFRIIFALVYLTFIAKLYLLQLPIIEPNFYYLLFAQIFITLFILLGYKYNIFRFLFFFSTLYLMYLLDALNGHSINVPATFRILAVLNIFILFLPLNATLSIDKLLRAKLSPTYIKNYNYTFVAIVVGLIYLDGAIYKSLDYYNWILHSDTYFLKVYLGANHYVNNNFFVDFIINHPRVAQIATLTTYLYQLSFIFIILFIKNLKPYLLILGILLHSGMWLFFDFSYVVYFALLLYIPLVPSNFYYKLFSFFRKNKKQEFEVIFDSSCAICTRYIFLIKSFDFKNRIVVKGKDLSDKNEILFNIKKEPYKGIDGFRELFRHFIVTYPVYLLLKISLLYDLANTLYLKFAKNRANIQCKLLPPYIYEGKIYLILYVVVSIIGLSIVKFPHIYKNYNMFYHKLSVKVGTIYPMDLFIVGSTSHLTNKTFYLLAKDKKILTQNYTNESKYAISFLGNAFLSNTTDNQYLKRLKNILGLHKEEILYICKENRPFTFDRIKSIRNSNSIKKDLDNYFAEPIEKEKYKECKSTKKEQEKAAWLK